MLTKKCQALCLNFRHLALLFVTLTLIAGCGPNTQKRANRVPHESFSYAKNAIFCDQSKKGIPTVHDQLIEVEDKTTILAREFFRQRGIFYYSPEKFSYEDMEMTPEKPMVLNDAFFQSELQILSEEIKDHFPGIDFLGSEADSFSIVPENLEDENFRKAKARLSAAAQLAVRYKNHSCQLNHLTKNRKNDVRPFYRLLKKECNDNQNESCLEQVLNNWRKGKYPAVKNDLIEVCKKLYSDPLCHSMLFYSATKKTMLSFYRNLKKQYQRKVVDPHFLMESKSHFVSCDEKDGKKILNIKLVVKPEDTLRFAGGIYSALAFSETAWSSSEIKLRIEHMNEGVGLPRVEFKKSVTSHVDNETKSVITLNSNSRGLGLTKTLAHELGHVLGFRDCYIEFFDPIDRSLIYYELERHTGNIMCSIEKGYKAPQDYLEQLAGHYCR